MKCKPITILMAVVLTLTAVFVRPALFTQEIKAASLVWKRLYMEFFEITVEENGFSAWSYFCLLDIDDDGIPELVEFWMGDPGGFTVYGISDNRVINLGRFAGAMRYAAKDAQNKPFLAIFCYMDDPLGNRLIAGVGELRKTGNNLIFTRRYGYSPVYFHHEEYESTFFEVIDSMEVEITYSDYQTKTNEYFSSFVKNNDVYGKYAVLSDNSVWFGVNTKSIDFETLSVYISETANLDYDILNLFFDGFSAPAADPELTAILEKISGRWIDKRYYESDTIDDSVVYAEMIYIDTDGVVLSAYKTPFDLYGDDAGIGGASYISLSVRLNQNGIIEMIYDVSKPMKFVDGGWGEETYYAESTQEIKQRYANYKIKVDTSKSVIDEIRYSDGNNEYVMMRWDLNKKDPSRYVVEPIDNGIRLAWQNGYINLWWPPCRVRLYRSEQRGDRGVMIQEGEVALWYYDYIDTDVEPGKTYYYSLWLYADESFSWYDKDEQILIGGDWQMKVEIPGEPSAESPSDSAPYIYAAPSATSFAPLPSALMGITSPETAETVISDILANLTAEQKQSGEALDVLALFIETAARKGAVLDVSGGADITVDMLNALADTASEIIKAASRALSRENISLLRDMRVNVTIQSDEKEQLEIAFADDVSTAAFDSVTIETAFAHVTLNKADIHSGSGVVIRLLSQSETADLSGSLDALLNGGETPDDANKSFAILDFWSAGVVALIFITWGILRANKKRLRAWVVPTFCIIAIAGNAFTYMNNENTSGAQKSGTAEGERITDGTQNAENESSASGLGETSPSETDENASFVSAETAQALETAADSTGFLAGPASALEVTLTGGAKITLCIPVSGGGENLILFSESGEAQYGKYNHVTDTIDSNIQKSGIYTLREYTTDFIDMEKKNDIMKEAVTQLASRGIMHGTTDGFFYPDKPITRAEFVSAVINVFDMLDNAAPNIFADIAADDWYCAAAATAQKNGLISGFPDNTFRGDLDIPKAQLVVIAANTLQQRMGYKTPADIETQLMRYADAAQLAAWSKPGIALATLAQVMLYREDGLFAPESVMTRGDAAVILYRVFKKAW